MAVTTGLIGQGIAPQFAASGVSAVGAAMDAGYNFAFGGSSSSGTQPMETEHVKQTRSELGDTGGEETKKRDRQQVVMNLY